MKIPALINFTEVNEKCFFGPETSEYKALIALVDEGNFKEYQENQLDGGVSVKYDRSSDYFVTQPQKFSNNELREAIEMLQDDEDDDIDIDIESDDDTLEGLMDGQPEETEIAEEPIEEPIKSIDPNPADIPSPEVAAAEYETWQNNEPSNNNSMQVVSLEDVMSLLQQAMGNIAPAPSPVTQAPPAEQISPNTPQVEGKGGPLVGGQEALKKVFFQGEGNETLDSDFDVLYDNIHNLESHTNPDSSYVNVIGGVPKKDGTVEQPGLKGIEDMGSESPIISPETVIEPPAEIIDMVTEPEVMKYGADQEPGHYEDMEAGLQGPERLVQDLPTSDDFDPEEDENKEMLLDIDEDVENEEEGEENPLEEDISMMEDGELKNSGLDRFGTTNDYSPAEETFEANFTPEDMTPAFEEPQTPAITANKSVNLGGQQVQIILTGVMITVPEIQYIGESVKKAGNKLKQIKGKGNELNIIVEANNNQYTINYTEHPRNTTKTPFSVKNYKFNTLEEALDRINYRRTEKEADVFNKIVGSDIMSRELNNINEANIFNDFKNVNDISTWTVRQVGPLNLKNGLNEVFSKITQTGNEPNTLVKDNENYYLIKGNLKERSKAGIKKELVDLKTKKTIGNIEVVGLYENTQEGLGKIMYKIQRTAIPLLVWK